MTKPQAKAAGEAVSNEVGTQAAQSTALTTTGDGDISGSLQVALSESARDEVVKKFLDDLHRVKEVMELTAPGEIFKMDRPFYVIDGATITNFVDRKTGEEKVKHIFKLQFSEGDTRMIMQSTAPIRAAIADVFASARQLGESIELGPYKFGQKDTGQIQPAYILVQQPGFGPRRRGVVTT